MTLYKNIRQFQERFSLSLREASIPIPRTMEDAMRFLEMLDKRYV